MTDKAKITQAIYSAIDEVNQQLPVDRKLEKSADTVLFGDSGSLDSLGIVNLVVITEENIEDEFGILVNIADQRAMSQRNSPFRTVGTLTEYIAILLHESRNGTGAA